MKITIITKECKTKGKDAPAKANLCFRLRDKNVDLKVRSDIEVMLDYWDNDALSYRRTKKLPSDEQKKVKFLVQTITTALSEQYNSATADVAWMKNVIDECVNPTSRSTETLTTVVSRMEQYIAEHPMSPKSALVYKPTIKKLQRYEAYKREVEGEEGFTLYCETIRPEDYLDFREVQGTPFYLTIEERDKVYNTNLHNKPELEVYRDLFIFQSMVGCRVGDMFSFTKDNIVGDILQYLPHKTMRKRSQTVSVPLTTKAMEILKRYDGKQEKLLPTKQVYQYNEGIRAVLRECGINRMVTILDTVTGKEVQKPICDVATSHMARRNFIGNLYKKVKDPELVSSMTGHVNGSRAFARYREIDEETKVNLVNLIN